MKASTIESRALVNLGMIVVYHLFSLVVYFIAANYYLGKPHIPAIPIDYKIPYIEFFVIIYIYAFYTLLVLTDLYYALIQTGKFRKYLFAATLNVTLACLIYIVFPTRNIIQAGNLPNTFLSELMQKYYEADVAMNCLPSLHVASSILSALFLYEDARKEYGWMALTTAILVSISTIFVRQHYVLDIPAGILHALFVYWVIDLLPAMNCGES